ncbi:MAG: phosphopyruvate hydratase [Patescibacteria group bacterium]|nr:phosphopyruvate hydratase [Patescibacteria group bacterium]
MPKITNLKAREILDSRGNPTIETTVTLDSNHQACATIPSGASTGKHEAVELRDNDKTRFNGLGVLKAVKNVNTTIAKKIIGIDPTKQTSLDQILIDLDGSENKKNLGSNAILSVSTAVLKAAAAYYKLPVYSYINKKYSLDKSSQKLPSPTFNIINGGAHGAGNLDFQEFHVIPSIRFPYHTALQMGNEIYKSLKKVLIQRKAVHSVGDEGGFAPNLFTNMDALEIILEAIHNTPYQFAKDVFLGLDVAANFFFRNDHYTIKDRAQPYSKKELIAYYLQLNKEYRLFSLEDGLDEEDWNGWAKLTESIGTNTLIVGDDLLTTNKQRVKKAIEEKSCNAILVKPNQIGTISETIEVIQLCKKNNWKIIVSHRSGETNDTFIADFAVGIKADYTKFGAPARGERIAKYNRLLAIEQELNLA